ncbi:head-to-tail stopper [Arthrobacter phage Wollypog]|uniref:Head-to-tail stopper n=1 Tax=Arthrobacter phage Wollypog TaxID=2790985 RepID=A0A7T3KC57_9CAUD|nr:head-to-tail stopper [Arthrobacter phage Wollypog]QPX62562.1 head-to-tail stopper [Arthrobacter phage Wollypog]
MISDAEYNMQLRQTRAFIAADSTDIVINPRTARESDGAGGFRDVAGEPLAAISVRLVPQSDKVPVAAVVEGRRAIPEMVLVALPDADIRRYDTFVWGDKTWKVDFLHDKPEYELKADLVVDNG